MTSQERLKLKSKAYNDYNNCSVEAIAKTCNVDMITSFVACKNAGRRHNCAAHRMDIVRAARSLGVKVTNRKYDSNIMNHRSTARSLPEILSTGRHLVFTCNHVFALNHGTIDDWCAERMNRVTNIYTITGYQTKKDVPLYEADYDELLI